MQQEVEFDLSGWCEGPYGCASPEEALTMVVVVSIACLCFTPNALRFLLPILGEPQTVADELGVPSAMTRRYLAIWAGLSTLALLWALGAWIDPLPRLVEPFALVGRTSMLLMFLVGSAAAVTLLGHLALLKIRRWQGRQQAGPPGRPTWHVIHAVGFALGFFWMLGFAMVALVTFVEAMRTTAWL